MPEIDYSLDGRVHPPGDAFVGDTVVIAWPALATTDTGFPAKYGAHADRTVQFGGTWGAGGAAVLEGSNDGVTYHTLTNPQGDPISASAAALFAVAEATKFVRPRVTGGDGDTAIDVNLFARGL